MGIYDRPYYQEESRTGFNFGARTMIANIVIVNVVLFVIDALVIGRQDTPWRPSQLLAVRADTILHPLTWWRFLTSGFAHDPFDMGHIVGNMLGLFFLGQAVEQRYGAKAFLRMYLTAVVVCSVVWSLVHYFTLPQAHMIGASGAVTCVILLFALNYPRRTVLFMMFIPMPAWVLGLFVIGNNLFNLNSSDNVAYDAHLTGALYAWLYFRTHWTLALPFDGNLLSKLKWPKKRPNLKLHAPEERSSQLDEQADAILDKLHRQGQESLSSRERKILEEYSRRMKEKFR